MVTGLEILLLSIVFAVVLIAARIVQTLRPFIINAIVGLIVLFLVSVITGFSIAVTPIALLIVAIGGVPGAILVLLLAFFGVAFVP